MYLQTLTNVAVAKALAGTRGRRIVDDARHYLVIYGAQCIKMVLGVTSPPMEQAVVGGVCDDTLPISATRWSVPYSGVFIRR